MAINLATMLIPMACLWISRNVLGLDDPLSDNLSANVIGLALGNGRAVLPDPHLGVLGTTAGGRRPRGLAALVSERRQRSVHE